MVKCPLCDPDKEYEDNEGMFMRIVGVEPPEFFLCDKHFREYIEVSYSSQMEGEKK